MTVVVERVEVVRLASVDVADGRRMAVETLEFRANCGCVCVFGVRMDNGETTCGYAPCANHEPRAVEFLAHLLDLEGSEVETSAWIAIGLDRLT